MTEKTDFPLVLPVTCLLSNGQDDSISSFQLQTISRYLVLKASNERNRSPMQSAPCLGGVRACIVLPVNYLSPLLEMSTYFWLGILPFSCREEGSIQLPAVAQ